MNVNGMKCGAVRRRFLTKAVLMVLAAVLLLVVLVVFLRDNDRFAATDLDVRTWYTNSKSLCGGNYTGYGHIFLKMYGAYFNPTTPSTIGIHCNGERLPPSYRFYTDYYAPAKFTNQLLHANEVNKGTKNLQFHDEITIAIYREYPHNFYHAMTQWYNVFVLSKLFQFEMRSVNILLLDRGPTFHIDTQWRQLFKRILKVEDFKTTMLFKNIIFSIPGHESPMYYFQQNQLPYVDEFSAELLNVFGLTSDKKLNCSNLTIVLAIRRDYFLHPETDTFGKRNTERKFKNEEEIVMTLRKEFSGHTIRTILMEDTSLQEQLAIMTQADVVISMHGCALTHTMFLPRHAAVLELYPKHWTRKYFFSSIARWRGIMFDFWINDNLENEYINYYTNIPTHVIARFSQQVKTYLCEKR